MKLIKNNLNISTRINNQIRAEEVRVLNATGESLGVMSTREAIAKAESEGLDLIEISATSKPPIAKIMDYGKFQYDQKKKANAAKVKLVKTETKVVQIKIGTGEHDLSLKAGKISKWLAEGNRVKLDLFLIGRTKYMKIDFLKERMERILRLITTSYKIADGPKKSPKGLSVVLERSKEKQS